MNINQSRHNIGQKLFRVFGVFCGEKDMKRVRTEEGICQTENAPINREKKIDELERVVLKTYTKN